MNANRDIVIDIVTALAEVEGREPHELEYALEDYVDTDALTRLAAMENTDWEVSFRLPDHSVKLTGDGEIHVDGTLQKVTSLDPSEPGV